MRIDKTRSPVVYVGGWAAEWFATRNARAFYAPTVVHVNVGGDVVRI